MSDLEGTIQFAYELTPTTGPIIDDERFSEIAAWRSILQSLDLVGQSTERYGGFAFGNMSVRSQDEQQFVITASQSSGHGRLDAEHMVRVTHCNLDRFWVEAQGLQPPSSESLTHAMIYHCDPRIRCVFHVHSPEIWQARTLLGLPQTPVDIPYGSPAMAMAVNELFEANQSRPLVFATEGHEDGIFATANQARECGGLLVSYLAKARGLLLNG